MILFLQLSDKYVNAPRKSDLLSIINGEYPHFILTGLNNIILNLQRGDNSKTVFGKELKGAIFKDPPSNKIWLICYDLSLIKDIRDVTS